MTEGFAESPKESDPRGAGRRSLGDLKRVDSAQSFPSSRRVCAVSHAELRENALNMRLDRSRADDERTRDFILIGAFGK